MSKETVSHEDFKQGDRFYWLKSIKIRLQCLWKVITSRHFMVFIVKEIPDNKLSIEATRHRVNANNALNVLNTYSGSIKHEAQIDKINQWAAYTKS